MSISVKGTIRSIIYRNEANGYTIATFYPDIDSINNVVSIDDRNFLVDGEITIVGYIPFINVGDLLQINGNITKHPNYGEQFKVDTFEKVTPKTPKDLEEYLSEGIIKGVGPATAKKIVTKFGEDTINVLRNEPEKLAEIKGINYSKAKQICEDFRENFELWQLVGFLQKFGVGPQSAQSIYKKLGINAETLIKENPYILENLGIKVDFNQIDEMAMDVGIERTSLKRINAGIMHSLRLASLNGHTCVLQDNLITYATNILGLSREDILDGIKDLASKEKIFIEKRKIELKDEDKYDENGYEKDVIKKVEIWIYLGDFYKAEVNVTNRIIGLLEADNIKKIHNIKSALDKVSQNEKIELSDKQKKAINIVNDNNVTIITGGPGTGKTTIIKTIIDIYSSFNKKVVLCAPTGRAAKRMTEATGIEATTVHRLLEIRKISDEDYDIDMDVTPISADIVVIDEMSMVDLFLMNLVLKGIYKGTKLILVGDSDQLPSVGPGNVLKDLIASDKIPYITLNKIFRQAAKSQIIVNSHKVNEGINFIEEDSKNADTLDDFHFIEEGNKNKAIEDVLKIYDENTQIITPTKKGDLGTNSLNKLIQEKFNPYEVDIPEKKFGDIIFRVGDKVMQTQNNYDIEWEKDKGENGIGIFNGEMGIITDIDEDESKIWIRFDDGKIASIEYQNLDQIVHAYAITIHKSQGSEFSKVILAINNVNSLLLTRNILYTGMTRAKDDLTIISTEQIISHMINNVLTKKRNSGLKYKLENYHQVGAQ